MPLFFMVCTLMFIHRSMYFGDDIFETELYNKKEQLVPDFMNGIDNKAAFNPAEKKKVKPKFKLDDKKNPKSTGDSKDPLPLSIKNSEMHCDPYSQFGYYDYQNPLQYNISFKSLDPDCQPLDPSPISVLEKSLPFDLLRDKTAVLIGDSVDRQNLELLCPYINGNLTTSDQDSHHKTPPGSSGGYPRLCYVEKYNLSISNYFFYGFDQDSIWTDKENVFLEPGDYLKRIDLAGSAMKSLGRKVDIAFINVGFWELARFDRLDHTTNVKEVMILRSEYVQEYQKKLEDFFSRIKKLLPQSRLVYRETHYPASETGPFFSTADTINRKHKFNRFKVHQINQVARLLIEKFKIDYWPIGTNVRDIPVGDYMLDDRKCTYLTLFIYLIFSNISSPPQNHWRCCSLGKCHAGVHSTNINMHVIH